MTCEKCKACGLVVDNHDANMAIQCAKDLGYSVYEMAMSVLHK